MSLHFISKMIAQTAITAPWKYSRHFYWEIEFTCMSFDYQFLKISNKSLYFCRNRNSHPCNTTPREPDPLTHFGERPIAFRESGNFSIQTSALYTTAAEAEIVMICR